MVRCGSRPVQWRKCARRQADPPDRRRVLCRPVHTLDHDGKSVAEKFTEIQGMPLDRRVLGINIWRSVSPGPLARLPLAVCDRTSIDRDDLEYDLNPNAKPRPFNAHYCKPNDGQRWNYFSAMNRDERWYSPPKTRTRPMATYSARRCTQRFPFPDQTTARNARASKSGFSRPCHCQTSAPSTPNLGVSASASVQPARRRLEGIAGFCREAPTTRMGVCGRALRVAAGASRTACTHAPLRLLGVGPLRVRSHACPSQATVPGTLRLPLTPRLGVDGALGGECVGVSPYATGPPPRRPVRSRRLAGRARGCDRP